MTKLRLLSGSLLLSLLSGCASVVPQGATPDPDPFQHTNRKLFWLNKELDHYLFKPVAKGYQKITNPTIRSCVRNFFSNAHEIPTTVNDVLQAEPVRAGKSLARFGVNTTVGLLGTIDVATKMGITTPRASFGQTLRVWGMDYSPYVMLPVLGPSTVRDTAGRFIDGYVSPANLLHWKPEERLAYYFLYGTSTREELLKNENLFNVLAFDEYVFVRNAYLQRIVNNDEEDTVADEEALKPSGDDFSIYEDEF